MTNLRGRTQAVLHTEPSRLPPSQHHRRVSAGRGVPAGTHLPRDARCLPVHTSGTGSVPEELGALLSRHSKGPFWSCESAVCGWQESLRSLHLSLVHDILRFAQDDHPDLRREGAVVFSEADSIASCDSLCLDPYSFVSDCLKCLSSSLAPHCGFLLSAVPIGFHVTGSVITPRRLAPLQLPYRLCVRAMHQLRVVDMSWHPDCGIGVQHHTSFGDASLLSARPAPCAVVRVQRTSPAPPRYAPDPCAAALAPRISARTPTVPPRFVLDPYAASPGPLFAKPALPPAPLQGALAANAPAGARRSSHPRYWQPPLGPLPSLAASSANSPPTAKPL